MDDNKIYHFNLPPIDIAEAVGMSYEDFNNLPQCLKWYYFHLVHYGINSSYYQYLPLN